MKKLCVRVPFARGLHARPAAKLVQLLRKYRARVFFRLGNRVANAGSVLSILLLAATLNTQLEIEAAGEDEDAAMHAAAAFFQGADDNIADDGESKGLPGVWSTKSP